MSRPEHELRRLWEEFHTAVNMTSRELRAWLVCAPDGADAYAPEPGIDVHDVGERVLRILDKRRIDLTADDIQVMREATDLIAGRLANAPSDDAHNDPWRHTLMTLGHDPLRPNSPRGIDAEVHRVDLGPVG